MQLPALRFLAYVIVIGLSATSTASGQIRFWLSPNALPPGSPVPMGSSAEFEHPLDASGTIYLWARPEPNETLANFSLNVVSSSDTVLQFDGVQIQNDLAGNASRFEFLFDSDHGLNAMDQVPCFVDLDADIPLQALWGFRGFTVSEEGGTGLSPASTDADPNYDDTNATWLLAAVHYTPLQLGTAELSLQVGEIGISQAGEQSGDLFVGFGNPSDAVLNAKTQRCVSSSTGEATIHIVDSIPGDFNNNGQLDAEDIDLLSVEVQNAGHLASFNLDGDPLVLQADRVFWVETLKGSFFGDANLDGDVDFDDFIELSNNFGLMGGWAQGDFDGNQQIGFDDFIALSNSFGSASEAQIESVPEPIQPLMTLILVLIMAPKRRAARAEALAAPAARPCLS